MDTQELEKLHRNYLDHNTIQSCFEYYRSNYTINEIYFIPKNEINTTSYKQSFSTYTPIEVSDYYFKRNILDFNNFSEVFYDRFIALNEILIKNKEIPDDEKIHTLNELYNNCQASIDHHRIMGKFSMIGEITTYIVSSEDGFIQVPLALINKDHLLNSFGKDYKIRHDFFSAIKDSITKSINTIEKKMNEDLVVISNKKINRYIVYELVAALCYTEHFKISQEEKIQLEQKLSGLLNIKDKGRRSDRIRALNSDKSKTFELEKLVSVLKEIKKFY